jgi:hypothetical protein
MTVATRRELAALVLALGFAGFLAWVILIALT